MEFLRRMSFTITSEASRAYIFLKEDDHQVILFYYGANPRTPWPFRLSDFASQSPGPASLSDERMKCQKGRLPLSFRLSFSSLSFRPSAARGEIYFLNWKAAAASEICSSGTALARRWLVLRLQSPVQNIPSACHCSCLPLKFDQA